MSIDIFNQGKLVGSADATSVFASIKSASSINEIAVLAGQRLKQAQDRRNAGGGTLFKTETWAEGFWSGFMDRADEIRTTPKRSNSWADGSV